MCGNAPLNNLQLQRMLARVVSCVRCPSSSQTPQAYKYLFQGQAGISMLARFMLFAARTKAHRGSATRLSLPNARRNGSYKTSHPSRLGFRSVVGSVETTSLTGTWALT